MRASLLFLVFILGQFFQTPAMAQKAVLIEEAETKGLELEDAAVNVGKKVETKLETKRSAFMREHQDVRDLISSEYSSTYGMRADRRVGVGVEAAGQLGMFGVNAELNFALDDSALVGFGGGPQYSSFELGWRHVFNGRAIAPFVGGAFSRWYNNSSTGGSVSSSTPGFLAQNFLNDYERQTGKFALNLLIPSAGLQYNMLNGPYVGTSLYAEVMMLLNVSNLQDVVTGAFGAIYYF